ncbi:MAG: CinA family nicotinamide mononucleotide deamidase-related protein, partial [Thermodesulfobacteriota bacterium]
MKEQVWAEIVTIGSELVLGQLVDTNAAYIASALAEIGVGVACHTTVGDDWDRLVEALRTALSRARIVIATGGIGPTEDDLTREAAAEVLGRELELRPELLEYIEGLFRRMGYKMAENNRKQAYVPRGAAAINNPRGTAPGFCAETDGRVLICLPGVPFETEPLIREAILPYLKEKFSPGGRVWVNRVLKVCGVGESNVDAQIKDIIRRSKNPVIGLQASPGEIKVRLTARADNAAEASVLLDECEARIREVLGPLVFGQGEETLAGNIVRLVEEKDLTLAVGEALTRGLVSAELGRRLGVDRFRGGLILQDPVGLEDLAARLFREFGPRVVLAVTGRPVGEDKVQIDILARGTDGHEARR